MGIELLRCSPLHRIERILRGYYGLDREPSLDPSETVRRTNIGVTHIRTLWRTRGRLDLTERALVFTPGGLQRSPIRIPLDEIDEVAPLGPVATIAFPHPALPGTVLFVRTPRAHYRFRVSDTTGWAADTTAAADACRSSGSHPDPEGQ